MPLNVFDQFGITIPCSATFSLEVGARISLKVATKGSVRGKKNSENLDFSVVFLYIAKRRSATFNVELFLINLASLYLAGLHIFVKSVHAFH